MGRVLHHADARQRYLALGRHVVAEIGHGHGEARAAQAGQARAADAEAAEAEVEEGEKMPTDKLVDVSPLALRMSSPFNAGYWLAAA